MQHLDTPNLVGLMPHGVMLHFGSFFLMIISSVNKVFHNLCDKIVGRLVMKTNSAGSATLGDTS